MNKYFLESIQISQHFDSNFCSKNKFCGLLAKHELYSKTFLLWESKLLHVGFPDFKNPCKNSVTVSREISKKSFLCVMWVGNTLKTLIFYMPLVFKCHFIATTAISRKIKNFFKKSEFFFVFEKKLFLDTGKL